MRRKSREKTDSRQSTLMPVLHDFFWWRLFSPHRPFLLELSLVIGGSEHPFPVNIYFGQYGTEHKERGHKGDFWTFWRKMPLHWNASHLFSLFDPQPY